MSVTRSRRRLAACTIAMLLVVAGRAWAQDDERARHVYEIFRNRCFSCHGEAREGGLDLRTHASLKVGSARGPVVVAHQPEQSRLFLAVAHRQQPAMPPLGSKLSDEDVEAIHDWIVEGGSFESVDEAMGATGRSDLARYEERPLTAKERGFWAFLVPSRTKVPGVDARRWRSNPIDAFLSASMRAKGLAPSPRADRTALVRRAYLDLLGLPPSPAEVDAFVGDPSPDAWPRLVDRVLASPHYGERWGRHSLDLVRYADSGGFEFDVDRPQGWRYLDYVVNAFNSDKPYDRFIREQIAGDEYFPRSDEAMIATGFLRLGPEGGGGGERGRQDALDDIIGTTTLTFMGMTVACARCHNHKFDPIPQKDYYRIQAVFYSTRPLEHALVPSHVVSAHRAETQRLEELKKPLEQRKKALEAPYLEQLVDAAVAGLPEYLQLAWRTPEHERDSTLIIWHGAFGRLPISERMDGRDHNASGFSVWLAAGGIKGGTIVGATDQYEYRAVENKKSVYDLHATILQLLGLDHQQLTYRFNGRDMRLTDVHGHVIPEILASPSSPA